MTSLYHDMLRRLQECRSQEDVDSVVKAARDDWDIGHSTFAWIMAQVKARRAELPERGEPK